MKKDLFKSDYEKLKAEFDELLNEYRELRIDYQNAEKYNDHIRIKLKATEKELEEYKLLLSRALEKRGGLN